jgi:mRNA-degrading endonuclease HigB of HigAB toxin-antitoxin module
VNTGIIDKFLKKHHTARKELEALVALLREKKWATWQELEQDFSNVRLENVSAEPARIVYKIRRAWRIDSWTSFTAQTIFVIRVGTHEEYNKWEYN